MNKRVIGLLFVGVVVGAVGALIADTADHYTSTDAFCGSSCHSMQAYVVDDPVYQQSSHRNSGTGVLAGCADCHLPTQGLLAKTWAHAKGGVKNVWTEAVHDLEKPEVWESLRPQLAYNVRDAMLADDSANCRACHQMKKIAVAGEKGQRAHARSFADGTTCIQCHINLVHAPVPPRPEFGAVVSE